MVQGVYQEHVPGHIGFAEKRHAPEKQAATSCREVPPVALKLRVKWQQLMLSSLCSSSSTTWREQEQASAEQREVVARERCCHHHKCCKHRDSYRRCRGSNPSWRKRAQR